LVHKPEEEAEEEEPEEVEEEAGGCMGERQLESSKWVARLLWGSGVALGLPQLPKPGILQCDISTHMHSIHDVRPHVLLTAPITLTRVQC
jgi:hypothetical protein